MISRKSFYQIKNHNLREVINVEKRNEEEI